MVLYIDTTDFNTATFVAKGDKTFKKIVKVDPQKSYLLAFEVAKFFKKAHISSKTLKKIVVCSGPGSYTGVRVGVVQAQGLSLAWGVPMVAIKKSKFKIPLK